MIRLLRNALWLSTCGLLLSWALAALYFDAGPWWSALLLLAVIAAAPVLGFSRRYSLFVLACWLVVTAWWLSLSPSNERDWYADVARLAAADIEGNRVVIRNLRNFEYQADNVFSENWETREYDLERLEGLDLMLVTWGLDHIAHTIASWRFADGRQLAISIETRKEKGENYSAIRGFFRHYEIYYVVADERDLIKIRTDHRGERVRLYRLGVPLQNARALLLDYLKEINHLNQNPRWYNALLHNCTTAIRYHNRQIGAAGALDWRLFLNDHLDELGYERGVLEQTLPFARLRAASDITDLAKSLPADDRFSTEIRRGLPGF